MAFFLEYYSPWSDESQTNVQFTDTLKCISRKFDKPSRSFIFFLFFFFAKYIFLMQNETELYDMVSKS